MTGETTLLDRPWTETPLVALDLEGTGAQDKGNEAILEVAAVPLIDGAPDVSSAYESLVNPGRPVTGRPWISPGLTDEVLRRAPNPEQVGADLDTHVSGRYLVGHNIGVDWRLLRLHYPHLRPLGLVDTLRLARASQAKGPKGLGALLDRFELRGRVHEVVPAGRPHRALWDTVAAAMLFAHLIEDGPASRTLGELLSTASVRLGPAEEEPTLF